MTERSAVRREGLADGALAALRFVVTVGVLFLFTRAFVAESFVVRGESMLPTLRDGDRLLVEKLGHRFGAPKYGEIVVFRPPGPVLGRGRYVKRVIGPPGETVELRGGRVLLSGRGLDEPYIATPVGGDVPETAVPGDAVFVLGDNRNHSDDSREFGPVPGRNLSGRAVAVFWPPWRWRILRLPAP